MNIRIFWFDLLLTFALITIATPILSIVVKVVEKVSSVPVKEIIISEQCKIKFSFQINKFEVALEQIAIVCSSWNYTKYKKVLYIFEGMLDQNIVVLSLMSY